MGLNEFDGVLAFGEIVRQWYLRRGWGRRVWTWHEAADINVFRPQQPAQPAGDLVWVGNWGDDERTAELQEFLLRPSYALGLRTTVHGVRYPAEAQSMLERHRVAYAGWIANHDVPRAFARHAVTIHVPRRPYVRALPGIPTIRVFEALACGIPLISAPWRDIEGLFPAGAYLSVRDTLETALALRRILNDAAFARELAATGLRAIEARHTCAMRVDELISIIESINCPTAARSAMHTHDSVLAS
jgi:spore maturation protein CgeB